jgi:hypothetical protein
MAVDYRVRTQIKGSLENNYIWNRNQPSATQIAFQLAFCYRIGFGTKSDENQSYIWLAKSAKRSEDLSAEKDAVRPASWKNGRRKIREFNEILDEFDLIHEYRTRTGIANLAATLTKHGRWKEAEELGLQVLEARKRVLGEGHPDTLTSMKNLAVTCSNQRRSKAAQEREIEMANKTQMKADEDNPLPAVSTTISAALNKESEVPRHLTDDNENCQAKVEIPRSETINVSTEQGKKMGPSPTTRSQTKKNRNVPQNEQGEKRSAFGLAGVVTKRQKRDGNTKNKGKKEHSHPIGL